MPHVKLSYLYRQFYSQWANGSRVPTGINVGYMFGVASFTGWEIGVPVPSNLHLETSRSAGNLIRPPLWDYQNASSLTNYIGFKKWTDARTNEEIYDELMNIFQLSSADMATIMSWVETYTNEKVLNLILDQSGINLFVLGSTLFSGFLFAGIIVVGTGIVLAVYATLVKKKER